MNAGGQAETRFRTAVVERGNLLATVSATGTLEPEDAIDVGAQVAGQIKRFGRDPRDPSKPIDFGAVVEEGTILAQLDDSLYASQVGQARANVHKAEADVDQAKAKLRQTERDWNRVRRLNNSKGVVSETDVDAAQSAFETARAGVEVCEAALAQAKETLSQAEINLGYTTIRSPVKGVILDRRVNVGQTVVASLNAPSLFLLATDLTRLQIWASVNEADIGAIHPGLSVRFSVDTYPDETFEGKVSQIRLNATMTMNVVTYTVVVDTDNSHQRLLPYMTANLQFLVSERKDVRMVANSALRWKPPLRLVAPEYRDDYARSLKRRPNDKTADRDRQNQHHVWVLEQGNFVRPVKVRTGLSDGTLTEIVSDEVHEGDAVVIGASVSMAEENSVNPFAPVVPANKK
jgi:HlyD family secretion protein